MNTRAKGLRTKPRVHTPSVIVLTIICLLITYGIACGLSDAIRCTLEVLGVR